MNEKTEIKEIISEFQKNGGNIFQADLYTLFNNHIFLIPILQQKSFENVSIVFLTDSNGDTFIPLYTDVEEFELLKQQNIDILPKQSSIYDCAKIVRKLKEVRGIVVNSLSDNLVLNRENINYILAYSQLKKGEQVVVGKLKEEYVKLKCALRDFMREFSTIKTAYLLSIVREKKDKNLTLVIEGTDEDCKAIFNFLNENQFIEEPIDILKLQSAFSKTVIEEIKPFYIKGH